MEKRIVKFLISWFNNMEIDYTIWNPDDYMDDLYEGLKKVITFEYSSMPVLKKLIEKFGDNINVDIDPNTLYIW